MSHGRARRDTHTNILTQAKCIHARYVEGNARWWVGACNNTLTLTLTPLIALTTINRDAGVRAVVLVGNGRVFTSGVDVKDAMTAMDSISGKAKADVDGDALQKSIQIRAYIEEFQEAITAIEKCAVPVIAALHGQVVGLGVDIACACDIRYAARSTRFSVKEVDLGLAGG